MGETCVKGGDERKMDTSEEKIERREKEGKERKSGVMRQERKRGVMKKRGKRRVKGQRGKPCVQ